MTKILCTPYSRKEAWELRATRYNVKRSMIKTAISEKILTVLLGLDIPRRTSNAREEESRGSCIGKAKIDELLGLSIRDTQYNDQTTT